METENLIANQNADLNEKASFFVFAAVLVLLDFPGTKSNYSIG